MDFRIDHQVLQDACEWFILLNSESASAEDYADWQKWLTRSSLHHEAWKQVEQFGSGLSGLETLPAKAALSAPRGVGRRAALKKLSVAALGIFGAGYAAQSHYSHQLYFQVQGFSAEYRTRIGELREVALSKSARLWVNTASSVDVESGIFLRNGEILLEAPADARQFRSPLWVESAHGTILAKGSRFAVRSRFEDTLLTVFDGLAEIRTLSGLTKQIRSGEQIRFNASQVAEVEEAEAFRSSWVDGILLVDNWLLADVVKELNRYVDGRIEVDPSVAAYRLAGVFSVRNIPQTLRAIGLTLNVQVDQPAKRSWLIHTA
ncbi:DUF4880 domain-containing protein [Thiomicrorhabdus sp.]|uniref:DUF4880 domain-containing protein n=1 Tax=Thiomicrorhabdus sp. TaxID=2039724 RepID=UPI0029C67111|nr:DUF4880 domain-containing protein [Thiomicrorhabdus sp.]